ncbi:MAG: helix-turn-helix transcriptional regulator [Candidatus Sulfotelmatobacter sp.]
MGQHRTDETPARTALRGSFVRAFNSGGWGLLTPREEPVVALAAQGLSNRDTAQELNLSEHPVKKYLLRILDKLGISSRAELVLCAVHHRDPRPAEWPAGIRRPAPVPDA